MVQQHSSHLKSSRLFYLLLCDLTSSVRGIGTYPVIYFYPDTGTDSEPDQIYENAGHSLMLVILLIRLLKLLPVPVMHRIQILPDTGYPAGYLA
jgi:hypothetical protein